MRGCTPKIQIQSGKVGIKYIEMGYRYRQYERNSNEMIGVVGIVVRDRIKWGQTSLGVCIIFNSNIDERKQSKTIKFPFVQLVGLYPPLLERERKSQRLQCFHYIGSEEQCSIDIWPQPMHCFTNPPISTTINHLKEFASNVGLFSVLKKVRNINTS